MNLQPIDLNPIDFPILFQDKNLGKTSYSHVTTINPIKVIVDAGWLPREVVQIKCRKSENLGFQKHRIRFYNPNLPSINGSHVEIILTNSYDTKSSFMIQLGIFRLVCANGLLVGDTYAKESIRHTGYSDQKIYDAISRFLPETDKILNSIDIFSRTILSPRQYSTLGKSIINMRLESENRWVVDDWAVDNLFKRNRRDDIGADLWRLYNAAQENICRNGFHVNRKNENGIVKQYKVRAIKNAFSSDSINSKLWNLCENVITSIRKGWE